MLHSDYDACKDEGAIHTTKNTFLSLEKKEKSNIKSNINFGEISFSDKSNHTSLVAQSFKKGMLFADLIFFEMLEDKKSIQKLENKMKLLGNKNLPNLDFLNGMLEQLKNETYKFKKEQTFLEVEYFENEVSQLYFISVLGHFIENMYLESLFCEIENKNQNLQENFIWYVKKTELLCLMIEVLYLQKTSHKMAFGQIKNHIFNFSEQNKPYLKDLESNKSDINKKINKQTLKIIVQNVRLLRNNLLELK